MNIRVKVEFEGQKQSRYAYATDEHSASSYGKAVIAMAGEAYGCGDLKIMRGTVVTSDKALAERLKAAGYDVRLSTPQADYQARNQGNRAQVAVSLTPEENKALAEYCVSHGVTPYAATKQAIRDLLGL